MDAAGTFFTAVPIDYFILGGIGIGVALDVLRSGVGRACSIAVALPIALLLHTLLDSAAGLGDLSVLTSAAAQAGTLAAILGLTYFLARRMGLEFVDGGMGQPVQALVTGAAVVVIFLVLWLHIPILDSLWHFNDALQSIFATQFRLFWLIGAYAALVFARG